MKVTPPVERPSEAAGYLGYYTRVHLGTTFDLVDIDGTSPPVWMYRKAATLTRRVIEEKPNNQAIHPSQQRCLRAWAAEDPGMAVYVLWHAERLITPMFPIRLTRLEADPRDDRVKQFLRTEFDSWLLDGLASSSAQEETWDIPCFDCASRYPDANCHNCGGSGFEPQRKAG